jgi:hypothetical protein
MSMKSGTNKMALAWRKQNVHINILDIKSMSTVQGESL